MLAARRVARIERTCAGARSAALFLFTGAWFHPTSYFARFLVGPTVDPGFLVGPTLGPGFTVRIGVGRGPGVGWTEGAFTVWAENEDTMIMASRSRSTRITTAIAARMIPRRGFGWGRLDTSRDSYRVGVRPASVTKSTCSRAGNRHRWYRYPYNVQANPEGDVFCA